MGSHVGIVEVGMEQREEPYRHAGADEENGPPGQGLGEEGAVLPSTPGMEEREQNHHGVGAKAQSHRGMDRPKLVREHGDDQAGRGGAAREERDPLPETEGARQEIEGHDP